MKEKKNLLILGALGVLALFLLILSFNFNNKEAAELPADLVEELPAEEVLEDEVVEEPAVEDTEVDEGIDDSELSPKEIAQQRYEKEAESNTKEITSKKYVSKDYNLTFEVPSKWIGKVSVIEQDMKLGFLYKGEHEFLSIIFVGKTKYDFDNDYYDALYRKILEIDRYHLLYAPASEHPLFEEEGSADYIELSSFVGDVETVVKTVKTIQ